MNINKFSILSICCVATLVAFSTTIYSMQQSFSDIVEQAGIKCSYKLALQKLKTRKNALKATYEKRKAKLEAEKHSLVDYHKQKQALTLEKKSMKSSYLTAKKQIKAKKAS